MIVPSLLLRTIGVIAVDRHFRMASLFSIKSSIEFISIPGQTNWIFLIFEIYVFTVDDESNGRFFNIISLKLFIFITPRKIKLKKIYLRGEMNYIEMNYTKKNKEVL
jgi:hypothetical protein